MKRKIVRKNVFGSRLSLSALIIILPYFLEYDYEYQNFLDYKRLAVPSGRGKVRFEGIQISIDLVRPFVA